LSPHCGGGVAVGQHYPPDRNTRLKPERKLNMKRYQGVYRHLNALKKPLLYEKVPYAIPRNSTLAFYAEDDDDAIKVAEVKCQMLKDLLATKPPSPDVNDYLLVEINDGERVIHCQP
jgi:hypothetical protein